MSVDQAITRFAPSPTGRLHLGHAAAAWFAADRGRFLLRIEDIDPSRCRPEWTTGIFEDLAWLGLSWEEPVRIQSAHPGDYQSALRRLQDLGVLYPCFCTRKEIEEEVRRAGAAPHGIEGPVYPGTCRALGPAERADRLAAGGASWRLDAAKAAGLTGPLSWRDARWGGAAVDPGRLGDVVVARKDIGTSYHLAVTVDDALQGVTLVTRGEDLREATHVQRLLQALLELPEPAYHHHALLLDRHGKRFAKRDRSCTLQSLREAGVTAAEIRERVRLAE
ncbi:MAG: tRNA glutamyl-Q(34) synthetase GluQRS [Verrucomicrobia bacterium]|nr:tRNA glutamyl-Q(34) synthetase GluQRS [Verrucomicrobiota bacterium]